MKIKTFKHGYGGREINFIGSKWCLRIARKQFALWKNDVPVFNFVGAWHSHRFQA